MHHCLIRLMAITMPGWLLLTDMRSKCIDLTNAATFLATPSCVPQCVPCECYKGLGVLMNSVVKTVGRRVFGALRRLQ